MKSQTFRHSGSGWMVAVTAALLLLHVPAVEAVVTTFDTSREGWQITGDNASTWVATGGNPGGCYYVDDLAVGNFNYAVAPPAYLGDWSGMTAADSISVDFKFTNTSGGPSDTGDYTFMISGPGGSAHALSGYSPPQGPWTTLTHRLDPALWVIDEGTWSGILEYVDTFMIGAEFIHGEEDVYLDNIRLSGPVSITVAPCVQETFTTAGTGDWTFQGTGGISNPGSGGNGGGYCLINDAGTTAYAFAPSRFLGDWTSLDGSGQITIDLRIFSNSGAITGTPVFLRLTGPGGVAEVGIAAAEFPLSRRVWKTHTYPLSAASWTVTSGTWAGLLANVTECRISLEHVASGSEVVGFDNFGRLQAGCPPLDQPINMWVTEITPCGYQNFAGITSVALNPVNQKLYGVIDVPSGSGGGYYKASGDSAGLLIQSYAEPDHLIFDAAGNAFVTEDETGLIHRYAAGGGSAVWVSGFHSGDDDPQGLCFAPPGFNGPSVAEGDLLVTDWGFNGPDEIWSFSPNAPENERLVMPDPGATDVDFRDLATGPAGTVYLVDERNANNLYTLSPTGVVSPIPLEAPLTGMVSLVHDSQSEEIYVLEQNQYSLQRIDPATGDVQKIADGFSRFGVCGLEIDVAGRRLWVTDAGAGRIYEFCLPAVSAIPEGDAAAPGSSVLFAAGAHPNPLRSATMIEFTLTRETLAEVSIFDLAGRRVRRLAHQTLPAGRQRLIWDGHDESGREVSSGIYFVRLAGGGTTQGLRVVMSR
jgi:sugar lactone lactonase YvrE